MKKYTYKKVSRWIKIKTAYVTERHSLYDYADDYADDFNCVDNRRELLYFIHKGCQYALDQFMRMSAPITFTDSDGKLTILSGYDCTNFYNPYLLEIHPDGEYVRLWNEVENDENDNA